MSFIQCKNTGKCNPQREENQFKLTQNDTVSELADKNIKTVIITIFHMLKKLSRDMKNSKGPK